MAMVYYYPNYTSGQIVVAQASASAVNGYITTMTKASAETISTFDKSAKRGYRISGWTKELGSLPTTIQYNFGQSVYIGTSNLSLQPTWKSTLILDFDANGGTVSPSFYSLEAGENYGVLPTPRRTGYTFTGWYKYENGQYWRWKDNSGMASSNTTLVAFWEQEYTTPSTGECNLQAVVFGSAPKRTIGVRLLATEDYKSSNYRLSVSANGNIYQYWSFNESDYITTESSGVQYNYYINARCSSTEDVLDVDSFTITITNSDFGPNWSKTATVKYAYTIYDDTLRPINSSSDIHRGSLRVGDTIPSGWFTSNPTSANKVFKGWKWTTGGAPGEDLIDSTTLGSGTEIFLPPINLTLGKGYVEAWGVWRDGYDHKFYSGTLSKEYSTDTLLYTQTKEKSVDMTLNCSIRLTRDHYTHRGWSTEAAGASWTYNFNSIVSTDTQKTLYPYWAPDKYLYKYYSGIYSDESPNTSRPLEDNTMLAYSYYKTYGVPLVLRTKEDTKTPCSRVGYDWVGWTTTDGSSQKQYSFGQTLDVNQNMTFYPCWQVITYTVYYNTGPYSSVFPNTNIDSAIKTYGTPLTLMMEADMPLTLNRSGYKHDGWSVHSGGTTKDYAFGASYTTESDITLYPYWKLMNFTATYKPGKSDAMPQTDYTQTITYQSSYVLKNAVYNHTNYNQTGWSVNNGSATVNYDLGATVNVPNPNDHTITATWTEKVFYTATFYNENDSIYTTIKSPENGGSITLPAVPAKAGYIGEWALESLSGNKYNGGVSFNLTSNVSFYPKYTKKEGTIEYYIDGTYHTKVKGAAETLTTLLVPSKTGYTFHGWYLNEDYSGTIYTEYNYPVHGASITFYGYYKVIPTEIHYSIDGKNVKVDSGEPTTSAQIWSAEEKEGYTFDGWYANSDYTSKVETLKYPDVATAPIILYGKYIPNDCQITYQVEKGSLTFTTKTVKYDAAIGDFPAVAADTGYTWNSKWFNGEDEITSDFICKGNLTLKATCEPNEYQIIYNLDTDELPPIEPTKIKYDELINELPFPEREGWTFLGWYKDDEIFEARGQKYNWTEDTTLIAKWRIIKVNKVPVFINGKMVLTQPYILHKDCWKKPLANLRYQNDWNELKVNPLNFK